MPTEERVGRNGAREEDRAVPPLRHGDVHMEAPIPRAGDVEGDAVVAEKRAVIQEPLPEFLERDRPPRVQVDQQEGGEILPYFMAVRDYAHDLEFMHVVHKFLGGGEPELLPKYFRPQVLLDIPLMEQGEAVRGVRVQAENSTKLLVGREFFGEK